MVLVVWDGLRPDSITPEVTPTLAQMAHDGVNFTRHHPVYPSSTEVNGTAMATGCYPSHSGIIGNREYRPLIDPMQPVGMEVLATIRKGDTVSGGHYLAVPTLPEIAHAAGLRTIIAGTKPVVCLMDRADRPADAASTTLFAGKTLPAETQATLDKALGGPFPNGLPVPDLLANAWTTQALTTTLWKTDLPTFSVLWLSDPDFTQHRYGVGSDQAKRALAGCDRNLATVFSVLKAGGWQDKTDVLVVSDHGFSTISARVDIAGLLTQAGLSASRGFKSPPKPGDILVDSLGGSSYLYVIGHDKAVAEKAVECLQKTDGVGVLFTRDTLPGTFPLSAAHIDSPDAPDIAVAFKYNDQENAAGATGGVYVDGAGQGPMGNVGQGTHASLSRYDLHNTLIAIGPDFKSSWRDELPTSNADLAPTFAYLLGLPAGHMDGRILTEALTNLASAAAPARTVTTERLEAASGDWKQYLQVTNCGGETYLDEGN